MVIVVPTLSLVLQNIVFIDIQGQKVFPQRNIVQRNLSIIAFFQFGTVFTLDFLQPSLVTHPFGLFFPHPVLQHVSNFPVKQTVQGTVRGLGLYLYLVELLLHQGFKFSEVLSTDFLLIVERFLQVLLVGTTFFQFLRV